MNSVTIRVFPVPVAPEALGDYSKRKLTLLVISTPEL